MAMQSFFYYYFLFHNTLQRKPSEHIWKVLQESKQKQYERKMILQKEGVTKD